MKESEAAVSNGQNDSATVIRSHQRSARAQKSSQLMDTQSKTDAQL